MSIRIMANVWENGPEDRSELLVLLALSDFANDEGECWPSMVGVAEKARMTERGAQKIVRRLEETGWLQVETGGGRGGKNKYRILASKPEQETPNEKRGIEEKPRTAEHKPRTGVQETPNGGSPEPSRTIKEPSVSIERVVLGVLEECASSEAVTSFIAYRRKSKGKALTETAAKRLANHLRAIFDGGGDPSEALGMAEERGWLTVEPNWYFNAKGKNGQRSRYSAPPSSALDEIAAAARAR